jgi:hypothetical protein
VELPERLRWLASGRFLRLLSALAASAVLAAMLYNAIAIDRVPPTFTVQVSDTTKGSLAMTLTSIDINFSENVQRETAESAFSMTAVAPGLPPVPGTFHWQGNMEFIFTPASKLPLSTKFHVHEGAGVEDTAGNAQSGTQDIDFTTVGPPSVAAIAPAADAQSVPVDSSIRITFDRSMDPQKVIEGLTLKPDITYQASWNGPVLTLDPTLSMNYGTVYTVAIGDPALDTDGTKLPPYTVSFTTVAIGLQVTALIPAPNVNGVSIHSQIAVAFDTPIDPASIAGAITVSPAVPGTTKVVSLAANGGLLSSATNTPAASATATNAFATSSPATGAPATGAPTVLVFTPDGPLEPQTTYSVTLSSTVKRLDGQVDEGKTWRFITGEPAVNALNQIAFISNRSGVDNVWLMNPDGSNQHEVTSELAPVSGYDISGDGTTIAYGAGGVVKMMSVSGANLTTLTPAGNFEYAPTITPDGTGVMVGRRDANNTDMGYWQYPLISGGEVKQVATDGAPGPGSVQLRPTGPAGLPGMTAWAPRAALTPDGKTMLFVRGADEGVEIVDTTGAAGPIKLSLRGDSRPVWNQTDGAFYMAASNDQGATWGCWRVTPTGAMSGCGLATTDMAEAARALALIVKYTDGSYHLAYTAVAGQPWTLLTYDPSFAEAAPAFSPSGTALVFARVGSQSTGVSAGIWTINVDGTELTILSTDGISPRWVP